MKRRDILKAALGFTLLALTNASGALTRGPKRIGTFLALRKVCANTLSIFSKNACVPLAGVPARRSSSNYVGLMGIFRACLDLPVNLLCSDLT